MAEQTEKQAGPEQGACLRALDVYGGESGRRGTVAKDVIIAIYLTPKGVFSRQVCATVDL